MVGRWRFAWVLVVATFPFSGRLAIARGPETTGPLSVVLVLADDLGWSDLGCYGTDLHETPRLDRLAREGVRFAERLRGRADLLSHGASIMTGKHPARLGMTIWREGLFRPAIDRRLIPPDAVANLPLAETTVAERLQAAGYLTAMIGKWHLGDADHAPESQGFDVNIGGTHWGAPPTYFFPYRGAFGQSREFRYVPDLEFGEAGEYLTDRLTEEALRVIDRAHSKGQPFFLYLSHHAPHTPIEARPELVERYERKVTAESRHRNPSYAAMVQSIDESVGRILDRLEAHGIADRALVVFTSDNGGLVGDFNGRAVTTNDPLRSGKGSLYEGGVRVPFIVRWPGVAPVGVVCDVPVVSTDLYRTILEATETSVEGPSDGLSLVPLLKAPASRLDREALFFHYPHYYPTTTPVSAVRSGDWKLLEYYEDQRVELFDLRNDPGEAMDLAAVQPAKAEELRGRLTEWKKEVGEDADAQPSL